MPQVSQEGGDRSIFAFLKRTGTDIAGSHNPTDLESLVRLVGAVDSFKYPAFNPALQEIVSKDGDQKWMEKISSDVGVVTHGVALQYLKTLAPADIPSELLSKILKRVRIQSRQDVADFVTAVSRLPHSAFTTDVRNAFTYVAKNAAVNNCWLGIYNSIFELCDRVWYTSRRHVLPTKLRQDLVEAGWSAFIRLDVFKKDSDFADAIKWLSFNEQVSGRKEEISKALAVVEVRGRSFMQHDLIPGMLKSILSHQKVIVPEPLDSVAQLLARKLRVSKLSISELEEIVEGLTRYFDHKRKAPQLEPVVSAILTPLLAALERNIANLPSRSMPAVLGLLARSGENGLVMQELERRGHEMSGPELVHLINSLDWVDGQVLSRLFASRLSEAKYVEGLLQCLTMKDRIELLATLAISGVDLESADMSILVSSLRDSLSSTDSELAIETIVRVVAAGDATFVSTKIVPSDLVKEFLESDRSGSLTVAQTLTLMNASIARSNIDIAKSLFQHILAADLDAGECIELLRASLQAIPEKEYIEKVLRMLVPRLPSLKDGVDQVLKLLPSEISAWADSAKYSPSNQLREEILSRTSVLSSGMSAASLATCFKELARLGLVSGQSDVLSNLVQRSLQIAGPLAANQTEAVEVMKAIRNLGVYNGDLLDILVRDFLRFPERSAETVSILAETLTSMGNKNEVVLMAVEQILRQSSAIALPLNVRISLLHSLAKSGVFSPLFVDQFRLMLEEASNNISSLSDDDWVKVFETHLAVLVESPPKIKVRFANDVKLKAFIDDNCAFSWYGAQERIRNRFIYSDAREQISQAMEELGWERMRVPELGKEVYHIDFVSEGSSPRVAVVTIPETDELCAHNNVRIIVGDSMTKVKHLQLFGYKVVPVWLREWKTLSTPEDRKTCMLRNSTQVLFALGTGDKR
jgi:hypothetical protein